MRTTSWWRGTHRYTAGGPHARRERQHRLAAPPDADRGRGRCRWSPGVPAVGRAGDPPPVRRGGGGCRGRERGGRLMAGRGRIRAADIALVRERSRDRRDRRRAPAAQARRRRQPERALPVPRREVAVLPRHPIAKALPLFRVWGGRRCHFFHPEDRPFVLLRGRGAAGRPHRRAVAVRGRRRAAAPARPTGRAPASEKIAVVPASRPTRNALPLLRLRRGRRRHLLRAEDRPSVLLRGGRAARRPGRRRAALRGRRRPATGGPTARSVGQRAAAGRGQRRGRGVLRRAARHARGRAGPAVPRRARLRPAGRRSTSAAASRPAAGTR